MYKSYNKNLLWHIGKFNKSKFKKDYHKINIYKSDKN